MADKPIDDITYADQLKQIQAQLAVLETSYANMTRTYYDMFYNNTPMDITLQIYNEEGELKTITVPNRAKSSTSTLTYAGSPLGVLQASLGTFVVDTTTGDLWYETSPNDVDGWLQIANTADVGQAAINYMLANPSVGSLIPDLSASHVTSGQLEVAVGGTGVSGTNAIYLNGILKMVPETTVDGVTTKAHIEVAEAGKDYLEAANLSGMIVFFPTEYIPAGYLMCDGSLYSKETYADLYNALTNNGAIECPYGETDDKFAVPSLNDLFIRCTTNFLQRVVGSVQDDAIPNYKGTLSLEITGGEENFTGAIQIALDEDNNYKQVDGKSSAPSGSYDYLINLNPQTYNETCARVYSDEVDEVRVKNIALVPAIKY